MPIPLKLTKGTALIMKISRKNRRYRNKIEDKELFAKKLRDNLPKSEVWFWEEWDRAGMRHCGDLSNHIVNGFIPDVVNRKFNYIIEIDGDIHNRPRVKRIDFDKNKVFEKNGYKVFRVEAFNYDHFGILCDQIDYIREKISPPQITRKPKTILRKSLISVDSIK